MHQVKVVYDDSSDTHVFSYSLPFWAIRLRQSCATLLMISSVWACVTPRNSRAGGASFQRCAPRLPGQQDAERKPCPAQRHVCFNPPDGHAMERLFAPGPVSVPDEQLCLFARCRGVVVGRPPLAADARRSPVFADPVLVPVSRRAPQGLLP